MFPRHLLGEGEELVLDVRPHWRVLAGKAAEGALIIFVGNLLFSLPVPGFLEFLLQPLRVVILLATLVVLAWRMIPALWNWASTQYVLTSDRLILRKGLIDRYTYARELMLSDVEDVQLRQSSWGRALGFGDLLVEARGAYRHTRFAQVPQPEMVQEEINHQIQALGHRPRPTVGQPTPQHPDARTMRPAPAGPPTAVPPGAPPGADVVGQLQHLAELRDRGVLDPEEFARLKRDLLGRL
jgi:hypothetical protein